MENIDNKSFILVYNYLKDSGRVYNQSDFARKLGDSRSLVSDIMNNKRPLSKQFVSRLCETFTELNFHFLLTGEGEMLKEANKSTNAARNVHSVNIQNNGDGNRVTVSTNDFVRLLEKKDEQIDRLLTLLENTQK